METDFSTGDRVVVTDGGEAFRRVAARVQTGDTGRVRCVEPFPYPWVTVRFDSGVTWYIPAELLALVGV